MADMKTTPEELLTSVAALDVEIAAKQKERDSLLQRWANAVCPHQVGDVVMARGYSYKGKRCRITKVFAKEDWKGLLWAVYAVVLRKDGSDSRNTAAFDQSDWERNG